MPRKNPTEADLDRDLTPTEVDTLRAYAQHGTIGSAAAELNIAVGTFKDRLNRIYKVLDVRSGEQAINRAWERGVFGGHAEARAVSAQLADLVASRAEQQDKIDACLPRQRAAGTGSAEQIAGIGLQLEQVAEGVEQLHPELAVSLARMSRQISSALSTDDRPVTFGSLDAADQALVDRGFRRVSLEFIRLVLDGHPEIGQLAERWGWHDAEVGDLLLAAACCDMIGINQMQYEVLTTTAPAALVQMFYDRHDEVYTR